MHLNPKAKRRIRSRFNQEPATKRKEAFMTASKLNHSLGPVRRSPLGVGGEASPTREKKKAVVAKRHRRPTIFFLFSSPTFFVNQYQPTHTTHFSSISLFLFEEPLILALRSSLANFPPRARSLKLTPPGHSEESPVINHHQPQSCRTIRVLRTSLRVRFTTLCFFSFERHMPAL